MQRLYFLQEKLRYAPTATMRFLAMLLVLVTVVAPSWHICMLGGHCAEQTGPHPDSHSRLQPAQLSGQPRQALVCYCPPAKKEGERPQKKRELQNADQLSASVSSPTDGFCLALLLQGVPGYLTQAPVLSPTLTFRPATYRAWRSSRNSWGHTAQYARGPPTLSL